MSPKGILSRLCDALPPFRKMALKDCLVTTADPCSENVSGTIVKLREASLTSHVDPTIGGPNKPCIQQRLAPDVSLTEPGIESCSTSYIKFPF